jgi:hypothetical protein
MYYFGTFCIHLVHFSGLSIMHQEKSGNTGLMANQSRLRAHLSPFRKDSKENVDNYQTN